MKARPGPSALGLFNYLISATTHRMALVVLEPRLIRRTAVTALQRTAVPPRWVFLSALFLTLGSGLQAYSNSSAGPLVLTLLLASLGIPAAAILARRSEEIRAFALTFGACVLAGGVAQCYALLVAGTPQDFGDAVEFFAIASDRPWIAIDAEHAWAVLVWQVVHAGMRAVGFDPTPGLGATMNAAVMGLVGLLVVSTARTLLGDDPRRLQRTGTLVASCGLTLLFGALMLRDCFVMLFDAFWVWAVIRWLARPGATRLAFAVATTLVTFRAVLSLRPEAVTLYSAYAALAVLAWYVGGRLSSARFALLGLVLSGLPIASTYVGSSVDLGVERQTESSERYREISVDESRQTSLGMRLVVNQPLPIRMVTGSGLMLAGTIPAWAGFTAGGSSYHWLKGYHTLFQLAVIPMAITGLLTLPGLRRMQRAEPMPLLFLTAWGLIGLLAVVASTLEHRHLSAFLISIIILSVVPDTRQAMDRRRWRFVASLWFATIVVVHVAWAVAALI